jgi:hypothetical protein
MATRNASPGRGEGGSTARNLASLAAAATLLALAVSLPVTAQSSASDESGPQFAGTPDQPELKYAVAHGHHVGWCFGYLYISRQSVRYEVAQPESDKAHGLTLQRADIASAGEWRGPLGAGPRNWFSFKLRKGGQLSFKHIRVQNVETGQLTRDEGLPYADLVEGYDKFDEALARAREREARLHPPPQPPVISLTEPSGTDAGTSVDALGPALRVRGVAAQASGVSAVSVNGLSASLRVLTPQTAEFEVARLQLNPGLNSILVVATARDQTQTQLGFQVRRPEVRMVQPALTGFETSEATVKVHGLAIGFRGVEKAEVAGTRAQLAKRDDGSVEFTAEGVPVALGTNVLTGSVTGSNGAHEEFRVELKRVAPPAPPALALAEVESALQNGLPKSKVASLVTEFGVDFALTDDNERRLRAAGADSDLLLVIAKAKK